MIGSMQTIGTFSYPSSEEQANNNLRIALGRLLLQLNESAVTK